MVNALPVKNQLKNVFWGIHIFTILNLHMSHVTYLPPLLISFHFTKLCPRLPSLCFLDPGLKLPPTPVDIIRYCESPVQRVGRVIGLPCPHNLTTSAHHRPADLRYFEASYELTWWITHTTPSCGLLVVELETNPREDWSFTIAEKA